MGVDAGDTMENELDRGEQPIMTPWVVFDFEGIVEMRVALFPLDIANDEVVDLTFAFPMVLVVDIFVDIVSKEAVIRQASAPPSIVCVMLFAHE